jgi:predicted metal-dependent phosphoesterase TrpH
MLIDLHTHTTASDGHLRPADLSRAASRAGVAVLGITDHDTAAGLEEARTQGVADGIRIVPGVELSTHAGGMDVHVLGYFIDPRAPSLEAFFEELRRSRRARVHRIVEALARAGVRVDAEAIFAEAGTGTVSRAHVARVLVRRGLVPSMARAFDRYLGRGACAYVPSNNVGPREAIRRIIDAGGVPVLAHPADLPDDGIIPALVRDGLEGLEVFSRESRPSEVERYARIARDFGLIETGGSDYHGEDAFGRTLGSAACPPESYRRLEARHADRAGAPIVRRESAV